MKLFSKMNLLMMACVAVFALGAISCSDDDKGDNGGNGPGPDPGPDYPALTPAEHKQNLEKTATAVLALINPEKHKVSIQTTAQFLGLMGVSMDEDNEEVVDPSPAVPQGASVPVKVMAAAYAVANGQTGAMIDLVKATGEEDESFDLKDMYGIYTYNAATESFDRTAAEDRIEYNFPGVGSATNNAKIVAHAEPSTYVFDGVTIPATLDMLMTVDNKEEMSVNFKLNGASATNNKEQIEASIIVAKDLRADLEMQTNMAATPMAVTGKIGFTVGETGKSANAGSSATKVLDITFNTSLVMPGASNPEMTAKTGEVNVRMLDIVLAAKADMEKMGKAIADYEKNTPDPETNEARLSYMEGLCAIYNANTNMKLTYNNEKKDTIAVCSMYTIEDYSFTTSTGKVIYYDMAPQLQFSDKSKIDFETYFGTGFESVIRKVYELSSKYEGMMK